MEGGRQVGGGRIDEDPGLAGLGRSVPKGSSVLEGLESQCHTEEVTELL